MTGDFDGDEMMDISGGYSTHGVPEAATDHYLSRNDENILNQFLVTRNMYISHIGQYAPLLPPLVMMVAEYSSIDPKIAHILRKIIQDGSQYDWNVKYRNNPSGQITAKISLCRVKYVNISPRLLNTHVLNSICITVLILASVHTGQMYLDAFDIHKLLDDYDESDGVTIRQNDFDNPSHGLIQDMYAIALTGLYKMV